MGETMARTMGQFFGPMLAVMAVAVGGCASTSTSESRSCASNLFFIEPGRPSTFYKVCEQQACGEPVNWQDVLVVDVENEDDLERIVAAQAGPNAQFIDQWYVTTKVGGSAQDTRNMQRAFAERGCNLLILGGTETQVTVDGTSPGKRFRWGSY